MMKVRLFSVLCAASLIALASCRDHLTGPNNTPTVSDTIAYWAFDGNLKDVTGNGHDGTMPGTIPIYGPGRFGNANHALVLDGQVPVVVADKSDLDFTGGDSFTIIAWVNTTDTTFSDVVAKGPQDGSDPGYQLGISAPLHNNLAWAWANITTANVGTNWTMRGINPPNITVSDGSWHMLTLVVTAHSGAALYTDSVLEGTLTDAGLEPELRNTASLLIGGEPTHTTFFQGSIEEVTILHHALDPVDVAARFHEGGWYEHSDTVTTPPATDSIWTPANTGTSDNLIVGQFVNSTTGFVSGANGTFLATVDAGSTWIQRTSAPVFQSSIGGVIYGISFFDASTGFAAGEQRDISETNDGGITWTAMNTDNVPQTDLIRSLYFTNRNTGFAGTTDAYAAPSGSICESFDGGQTWNKIYQTSGGIYNIDFNSFTNNMDGVALGRFGVVYWTSNGGSSWNEGTSDQPTSLLTHSTFTSATTGFAVGAIDPGNTIGFILRTDDAGHTWHTVYTSSTLALAGIASNGAGTITAVGVDGIVVESTDGGTTWAQSFAGSSRWTDIRYASQHRAVLIGDNGNIDVRDK
ncbi:MAG TPA: LamG-like jellyroll fold domain-containing protein [Candidatus Kapabacteria bacterium]|nr:LamG-like jellyroll fold domain-containing protein [Candidatus Kapabacteria bacterium]